MKRPEDLEPDLSAEDLALVEALEFSIERSLAASPGQMFVNWSKHSDRRLKRHHWDEFTRRALAAGWQVEDKMTHVFVQRPMPTGPPRAVRFAAGRPASNVGLLRLAIDIAKVNAVYDPYLDDRALQLLLTLRNLGVSFSEELRLLGRDPRRLTKQYADNVMQELPAPRGEVRTKSGRGHDNRLIFLDGGEVVAVGCSLNNLDVNERPHRDADKGDLADFDTDWPTATALT